MKRNADVITWGQGEVNRPLRAQRPCDCGCDERDGLLVGYISGSNAEGSGFTVRIHDEDTYRYVERVMESMQDEVATLRAELAALREAATSLLSEAARAIAYVDDESREGAEVEGDLSFAVDALRAALAAGEEK
jgi:hypothetical protein